METQRNLHVVHLLIRNQASDSVRFLVYPHDKWKAFWTLPAKKTVVVDPFAPFLQGTPLEHFLETLLDGLPELSAEEAQHFLTLARDQALRMQRLIEDLLTLSALESSNPLQSDERVGCADSRLLGTAGTRGRAG